MDLLTFREVEELSSLLSEKLGQDVSFEEEDTSRKPVVAFFLSDGSEPEKWLPEFTVIFSTYLVERKLGDQPLAISDFLEEAVDVLDQIDVVTAGDRITASITIIEDEEDEEEDLEVDEFGNPVEELGDEDYEDY